MLCASPIPKVAHATCAPYNRHSGSVQIRLLWAAHQTGPGATELTRMPFSPSSFWASAFVRVTMAPFVTE
jgi:hypothetical protein